jgi:hypothetical protein
MVVHVSMMVGEDGNLQNILYEPTLPGAPAAPPRGGAQESVGLAASRVCAYAVALGYTLVPLPPCRSAPDYFFLLVRYGAPPHGAAVAAPPPLLLPAPPVAAGRLVAASRHTVVAPTPQRSFS